MDTKEIIYTKYIHNLKRLIALIFDVAILIKTDEKLNEYKIQNTKKTQEKKGKA